MMLVQQIQRSMMLNKNMVIKSRNIMNMKNVFIIALATFIGSASCANASAVEKNIKKPTLTIIKDNSKVIALKVKKGTQEVIIPLSLAFMQAGLACVLGYPAITAILDVLKYSFPTQDPAGEYFHKEFSKVLSIFVGIGLVLSYQAVTDAWTIEEAIESEISSKAKTLEAEAAADFAGGCSGGCCC